MWTENVRPYSLEISIFNYYEYYEIIHFRFSSKYMKSTEKKVTAIKLRQI